LAALFLAGNNDIVLSPLLFSKKIIFYFVSLSSNKDMLPQKIISYHPVTTIDN